MLGKLEDFNIEYNIHMTTLERFQGCLAGGAIGDALGAPVEFMKWGAIKHAYGEKGIQDFDFAYGRKGAITDDTQMTMFTVDALCQFFQSRQSIPFEVILTQAYLYWLETQENDYDGAARLKIMQHKELWSQRAPGLTCLGSLKQLKDTGITINNRSKGCGGVMRSAPIGLTLNDPDEAYCAGKMCALVTHHDVDGFIPAGALARMISLITHHNKTFEIAQSDTFDFIKKEENSCGTIKLWELAQELHALDSKFNHEHFSDIGEGWTGDEALAMSIYCALKNDTFLDAIINAVNHSGDSDSTGSITGQLIGTQNGVQSLPVLLLQELELGNVIMEQAEQLHGLIYG
jgi:ADP-ribosylglycohydrolase